LQFPNRGVDSYLVVTDLVSKIVRMSLAVIAGLASLPALIFSFYLLRCFARIHTTNVYYVEYPYLVTACVFTGIGLLGISCTVYGLRRRSFHGAIFLVPLILGLATLVYIPDATPHAQRSSMDDVNYLSDIHAFFGLWYDSHQRFPKDDAEFQEALKEGPAAWQFRVSPAPQSDYARNGQRLPYQVVVVGGAAGPKLSRLSERPGVIYYCVSADDQQFWVTMTGLLGDVAPKAALRTLGRPYDQPWVITASGKDYAPPRR